MYLNFKNSYLFFITFCSIKNDRQLETIKNLESEMTRLKYECNHKMSKVQQKTQEYVTSEYEKKFERKREQMVN